MNLESIIQQLGIPTAPAGHHHQTNGWIQIDCPWCSPNMGKYRMGLNKSRLNANCWSCGTHWIIRILATAANHPLIEVKKMFDGIIREHQEETEARGTLVYPDGVSNFAPAHEKYLLNRKLDPKKMARLWGLRGLGLGCGELSWRLFIPIRLNDEIVSWTTRSISDEVPKRYHSARPDQEKIDHKSLIFGADYCRHAIIVTEGPFDVFRIGPGAGCLFGTGFTKAQVRKLAEYQVRAILFDNEKVAQKRAQDLADALDVFDGETYVVQLKAKDPGEANSREIMMLRNKFLGERT